MEITEIKHNILCDNDFVLNELQNFLTYYNLKHTLRWGTDNALKDEKESVAEHVFGAHILAEYFSSFYPDIDKNRVHQLLTWHDMAEAVVDDMTTRTKTVEHEQAEKEAESDIVKSSSDHLKPELDTIFREFNDQKTPEAKFAKAIDKIEPLFQMYFMSKSENLKLEMFKTKESGWKKSEYRAHREKYIGAYDVLWAFDTVLTKEVDRAGFFHPE